MIKLAISKEKIKVCVSDLFSNFLYYDRKEDEDFTLEDAENLPNIISHEELLTIFIKEIEKIYKE